MKYTEVQVHVVMKKKASRQSINLCHFEGLIRYKIYSHDKNQIWDLISYFMMSGIHVHLTHISLAWSL